MVQKRTLQLKQSINMNLRRSCSGLCRLCMCSSMLWRTLCQVVLYIYHYCCFSIGKIAVEPVLRDHALEYNTRSLEVGWSIACVQKDVMGWSGVWTTWSTTVNDVLVGLSHLPLAYRLFEVVTNSVVRDHGGFQAYLKSSTTTHAQYDSIHD